LRLLGPDVSWTTLTTPWRVGARTRGILAQPVAPGGVADLGKEFSESRAEVTFVTACV